MKTMMTTLLSLVAISCVQADQAQPKMPVQTTNPNPSARWGVKSGANLFITGEALAFKIAQDTLPYAYSQTPSSSGNITDYHMDFDYKWGFRVAAGYNICHDQWDVVGTYTRFDVSTTTQVSQPATGSLYSYINSATTLSSAQDKWEVDFNLFDIEQGRQFFVSKFLRLRPKFGLRNLFLDNDQHLSFVDTSGNLTSIKNDEHFWGMGILAGLDTVWTLGQGFSLYGNVGLAGLFGYFSPSQTIKTGATTQHTTKSGHLENTKGNLDLALGLRWDKNFYDDRYHIAFNFGFEEHMFFNMNRNFFGDTNFENFTGLSGRDFTLSGFSVGARFDF